MKGYGTTVYALITLYEFLVGIGLLGDVVVLMHSTTSICPQVGARCYPDFVDN
jgi:hypothetical protein